MGKRLIIAGGRDFVQQSYFDATMVGYTSLHGLPEEIVSGKCLTGADKMGEELAVKEGIPVKEFVADWDKHGKAAGPIRNRQMAEYADIAIVFWDGKSRGSKNMIDEMNRLNKPVTVIRYSI